MSRYDIAAYGTNKRLRFVLVGAGSSDWAAPCAFLFVDS